MKIKNIFTGLICVIAAVSMAAAMIFGYLIFRLSDLGGMKSAVCNEKLVQASLKSTSESLEFTALYVGFSETERILARLDETEVRRLSYVNAGKLADAIFGGTVYEPEKLADSYFKPITDKLLDEYAGRTGIAMVKSEYENIPLTLSKSVSRDLAIINVSSINSILKRGYYSKAFKYISFIFYALIALFCISAAALFLILRKDRHKLYGLAVKTFWFGSFTALVPSVVLIFVNLPDRLNVGYSALKMFTDGIITFVVNYMFIIPAIFAVVATVLLVVYLYKCEKKKEPEGL